VNTRPLLGLILALLFSFFLGGSVVWLWTTTKAPAEAMPSSSAAPPASDSDHRSQLEKFFGGDPDRNVRGGQEMKPRW